MEPKYISKTMLKRLPVYLDHLRTLPESVSTVSATTIARNLGLGDVLVRKDLAQISTEGRCRTGRSRERLIQDLENYLNLVTTTASIIVGAGKLGQALLDYSGFEESGLRILAGFDIRPTVSHTESGKPIYPMNRLESFCRNYDVRIGIIAVPDYQAQAVCDSLVACGIRAIWNFAPVHLKTPDYVLVQNENLAASLTSLRLQLKESLKTQ